MKTLIINGSPRKNGDTVALLTEMKKYLEGDIVELSAYRNNISPCIDCRYCLKEGKCAIKDDMQIVYDGDYENIVIASPVYMSSLPAPLISMQNRFQLYYAAKRFLNKKIEITPKKGALILVGGGDGAADGAIKIASWMLKKLGATYSKENYAFSLKTDELPASQDEVALQRVKRIAENLNKSLY
jgi:multimeric flavodoxin WrbA